MYETNHLIDAAAIAELPGGTWFVEYREVSPHGQVVGSRRRAEGEAVEPIRAELKERVETAALPVGRVRIANAQSVHIQFGEHEPSATLSIHLPVEFPKKK